MNLRNRMGALMMLVLVAVNANQSAFAHAGHDNAPGDAGSEPTSGPITITAEAQRNLNLTVEEANIQTVEKTLTVIGQIEAIPSRSAAVTSRISGRVTALFVTEGQTVKKGQALVEVESRQPGEPPPRVQYASPIDGIVVDRHAALGDTVEPDKHLLEVVDLNDVYAEGRVFEGQIPWVKVGQKTRIVVESYPDKIFAGTVELVAGALDPESRTLRVWIRIPNPDHALRPNMRATLNIITSEADSAIAIPKEAILGDAGHLFVFVQSDTNDLIFERRNVVTGISDDRFTEIVEGVFPSDKIVTTGNYQLQYVTTKAPSQKKGEASAHEEATSNIGTSRSSLVIFMFISFVLGAALARYFSRRRDTASYETNS